MNPVTAMRDHVVVLSLLLAGCGDPFSASAEAEQVCFKQLREEIPAASAAPGDPARLLLDESLHVRTSDLSKLQEEDVDATLGLQSMRLSAPRGTFAGAAFSVTLQPFADDGGDLVLVEFPSSAAGGAIHVERSGERDVLVADLTRLSADLLRFSSGEDVELRLRASGALPTEPWFADVEICGSASARYDYGQKLGL